MIDDGLAKLLAKAREGTANERPGARERIWKRLDEPQKTSRAALWLIPALGAAAALALFFLQQPQPEPEPQFFATVTLASGDVQSSERAVKVGDSLPEGAQLKLADKSRAYTRLPRAGALFHEKTKATLRRSGGALGVGLETGSIVAAVTAPLKVSATKYTVEVESALFQSSVAPDGVTAVYVLEGTARVRGPSTDVTLHAGESWSSATGTGKEQIAPKDAAAARALAGAAEKEAVLRISKPVGAQISLDGVELGRAPLEVVAKLGAHEVIAVHRGVKSTARATVAAQGGEVELPEPSPPPLPDISFEPEQKPEGTPEAHPKRVQPPADPAKRYLLARSLAQKGRYAEAVSIYESLAAGGSGWAEPSQYEVARLELRALKDFARARTELDAYKSRYPNGSLAHEAALSAIEVQLKLGDGEQALKEMDDFLLRFPTSERASEVRNLRDQVRNYFEGTER